MNAKSIAKLVINNRIIGQRRTVNLQPRCHVLQSEAQIVALPQCKFIICKNFSTVEHASTRHRCLILDISDPEADHTSFLFIPLFCVKAAKTSFSNDTKEVSSG